MIEKERAPGIIVSCVAKYPTHSLIFITTGNKIMALLTPPLPPIPLIIMITIIIIIIIIIIITMNSFFFFYVLYIGLLWLNKVFFFIIITIIILIMINGDLFNNRKDTEKGNCSIQRAHHQFS